MLGDGGTRADLDLIRGRGNQAGEHVNSGVDTDVLMIGARTARIAEELPISGDQAHIGLGVAAVDRQDGSSHPVHRR